MSAEARDRIVEARRLITLASAALEDAEAQVRESPPPMDESMLTVRQVQRLLNLSERTVYNLIDAGTLRVYRFGRAVRISKADLETYVNSVGAGGAA